MVATRISDYTRRSVQLEGYDVVLTSYAVGDRYYCASESGDPGAAICLKAGASGEEALQLATAATINALQKTAFWAARRTIVAESAPPRVAYFIILGQEGSERRQADQFGLMSLDDRVRLAMQNKLAFYDHEDKPVSVAQALDALRTQSADRG
ncbi:MAG: hypothetical protein WAO58_11895 [Fimbriimonadaceae bacterium]